MNTRTLSNEGLALLLQGLRAIYVADHEPLRQKMMADIENALAARGLALAA